MAQGRLLRMSILRRPDETPVRLGVVTSRRVGGAVQRNRVRRRLRENFPSPPRADFYLPVSGWSSPQKMALRSGIRRVARGMVAPCGAALYFPSPSMKALLLALIFVYRVIFRPALHFHRRPGRLLPLHNQAARAIARKRSSNMEPCAEASLLPARVPMHPWGGQGYDPVPQRTA